MNDNEPTSLERRIEYLETEILYTRRHTALLIACLIAELEKSGHLDNEQIKDITTRVMYSSARLRGEACEADNPSTGLLDAVDVLDHFDEAILDALAYARKKR